MRKFWILTFILLSVFEARARRGFHDYLEALPKPVLSWAARTYMVYSEFEKQPVGTAFLVHTNPAGLHFITARHVAYHCAGLGSCTLRWGGMWSAISREQVIPADVTLPVIDNEVFETENPNWKQAILTAGDMAYFRAEPNSGVPPASIQDVGLPVLPILPATTAYQRHHYVLGYPYLARRPSLKDQPSSREIRLRWSEGDFMRKQPKGAKFDVYTDADSLGGNSGGPVIHEDGTLLGILYGGPNSYEYIGYPAFYSYVVPIDHVRILIGDLLLKKQNHISICKTIFGKQKPACQK